MRSYCTLCILSLLLAYSQCLSQDAPKAIFTPSLIQINRIKPHNEIDLFRKSDVTRIEFLVKVSGMYLFDTGKKSIVTSFEDDKGTKLLSTDPKKESRFSALRFNNAGDTAKVSVTSDSLPAKGANRILVKGEISFLYGQEEIATPVVDTEFTEDKKFKCGDLEVKVGDRLFDQGPTIIFRGKFACLKKVTVLTPDGKVVEAKVHGAGRREVIGGKDEYWCQYILAQPVPKGSLKVTYFLKEGVLKVPVDLSVSLGLD